MGTKGSASLNQNIGGGRTNAEVLLSRPREMMPLGLTGIGQPARCGPWTLTTDVKTMAFRRLISIPSLMRDLIYQITLQIVHAAASVTLIRAQKRSRIIYFKPCVL